MTCRIARLAAVLAAAGGSAFADFTYEQTTKMTGGAMMVMLRMAGPFAKQAREPQVQTTMVQGDRLATIHGTTATIIDLGKETFTEIDFERKTYSVLTFAEMAKAMEAALAKMKGQSPAPAASQDASMKLKIDVKGTGQTRTIQGLEAKETILSFETEATDLKTGQKGSMLMAADMWHAAAVPGYDEIKRFHERMAQKIAWRPGQSLAQVAGPMADTFKNMAEVNVQAAKMEGIPVLQITRMAPKTADLTGEKLATMPLPPDQTAEAAANAPTVSDAAAGAAKEAAAEAAVGAAAGRAGRAAGGLGGLAGGLGGFGGFGRKKKQPEQQQAPPQPPPLQQEQQPPASGDQVTVMMEMTTEMTSFSSSADPSKMEVPAGFKKVEPELLKQLRK